MTCCRPSRHIASCGRSWRAVSADVKRAVARFPDIKDEFTSASTNVDKALKERRLDEADKLIDGLLEKIGELNDEQLRFENWYSRMEEIIDANAKGASAEAGKIRDARTMMLAAAKSGARRPSRPSDIARVRKWYANCHGSNASW